jgi:hypothetical protein
MEREGGFVHQLYISITFAVAWRNQVDGFFDLECQCN